MTKAKKVKIFKEMRQALRDAARHERGESVALRVTEIAEEKTPIRQQRKTRDAKLASKKP